MITRYKGFGSTEDQEITMLKDTMADPNGAVNFLSETPYASMSAEAAKKQAKEDAYARPSWFKLDPKDREQMEADSKDVVEAYTWLVNYLASQQSVESVEKAQKAINAAQYYIFLNQSMIQRYQRDQLTRLGIGVVAVGISALAINALLLSPLLIGPYMEGKMRRKEKE